MTYPARQKFYSLTNPTIEGVPSRTDTPLIDLAESFTRICPTDDCPGWLLPDQHPTAVGYRRVAETIVDRLAQRYPP